MNNRRYTITRFRWSKSRVRGCAVIAATLLTLSGCDTTEAPPRAPVPAPPAAAATPRLTLPDDVPRAVPLLESRRIHSVERRSAGAFSIVYAVPEIRRKAAAFYRRELSVPPWEVRQDSTNGGMVTISARGDDGRLLTVNIIDGADGASTMIGLYYSPAAAPGDEPPQVPEAESG